MYSKLFSVLIKYILCCVFSGLFDSPALCSKLHLNTNCRCIAFHQGYDFSVYCRFLNEIHHFWAIKRPQNSAENVFKGLTGSFERPPTPLQHMIWCILSSSIFPLVCSMLQMPYLYRQDMRNKEHNVLDRNYTST